MSAQARKRLPPIEVRQLSEEEFTKYEAVLEANREVNRARKALKMHDETFDRRRVRILNVLNTAQKAFDAACEEVQADVQAVRS